MFRRTLAASFRVETDLANGEQALALLRSGVQVDLLLADIVMPGDLQGLELVEIDQAEKPVLKAVKMTGYAKVRDKGGIGSGSDQANIASGVGAGDGGMLVGFPE